MTDLAKLVETGRVAPGAPDRSRLLKRVVAGEMPPEEDTSDPTNPQPAPPRPSAEEVALLQDWVKAGAPAIAPAAPLPPPITDADLWRMILDDLKTIPSRQRRFARYFSLAHLKNAGLNHDQLQTHHHGLSKLINSLSWNRRITPPRVLDPAGVLLRIDLRDYLWDETTWTAIIDQNPYGVYPDEATANAIAEMTGSDLPMAHADWFVFAASRPPLYHDILRLPATVLELERKLDVDAEMNIRQDRVARAGFHDSGIARNNRLIERHESAHGSYWRTYDFATNAGRKNLFSHPLGPGGGDHEFQPDGGEVIFALPNGLNGYMQIDGQGGRIDKGSTQIVRDNKQADGAVVNGISCMGCHARGLIEKRDEIRDLVAKTRAFDQDTIDTVMELYPPLDTMKTHFKVDLDRFARAVKATGSSLSQTEPIDVLARQFESDVDLKLAAAESGLTVETFRELLNAVPTLQQELGPLLSGGSVKRDAFAGAFARIAETRGASLRGGGAAFAKAISGNNRSRRVYPPERLEDLPAEFFGGNNGGFHDVGPASAVLVGCRTRISPAFGGTIGAIQPIFRVGRVQIDGEWHGATQGPDLETIAKPGYAVGAIHTRTGLIVCGFELVYMRIKGDRLDPTDSYTSPWFGDKNGGGPTSVSGEGKPVVGLQGRSEKEVGALGLTILKEPK